MQAQDVGAGGAVEIGAGARGIAGGHAAQSGGGLGGVGGEELLRGSGQSSQSLPAFRVRRADLRPPQRQLPPELAQGQAGLDRDAETAVIFSQGQHPVHAGQVHDMASVGHGPGRQTGAAALKGHRHPAFVHQGRDSLQLRLVPGEGDAVRTAAMTGFVMQIIDIFFADRQYLPLHFHLPFAMDFCYRLRIPFYMMLCKFLSLRPPYIRLRYD